ncbi:hypothetical protein Tco_0152477 [Tanacetum coccineum]
MAASAGASMLHCSLHINLQLIWQPSQDPTSSISTFLAVWQPSQQPTTYMAASAGASKLRCSLHISCNLLNNVEAFLATRDLNPCGRIFSSLQPIWQPPQELASFVVAFTATYNLYMAASARAIKLYFNLLSSMAAFATAYNLYDNLVRAQLALVHTLAAYKLRFIFFSSIGRISNSTLQLYGASEWSSMLSYSLHKPVKPICQPLHEPASSVAAFPTACNLCGSLRSSVQPMWQPPQQPTTFVAAFTATFNLCRSLQTLWKPSHQPSTYLAAFVAACNLCYSLRSSQQPPLQP